MASVPVAYVLNGKMDTVTPISTATNRPGTPIKVPTDAGVIVITPDGKTAYVPSDVSGTVTPISTATNKAGKPIKVGGFPGWLTVTPDGKTLYVANIGSGTVTAISTATNTVVKTIKTCPGPGLTDGNPVIAVTPDSKTAYVICNRPLNAGTVLPIRTATNTTGKPITVGKGAFAIAITP
jgi:YVTN family beta-propeller protein